MIVFSMCYKEIIRLVDILDINTETFSFTGKKKGLNLSMQLSLFW